MGQDWSAWREYHDRARESLERWGLLPLFNELRTGLYHVTSPHGFQGIRQRELILPSSPDRPFTFPQTENSYALLKRYVALFDFESRSEEECLHVEDCWSEFLTKHEPFNVIVSLRRERLPHPLVTYEDAQREVGYKTTKIPYVEVWYPEPVPWSAIDSCLLVKRVKELWWKRFALDEEFIAWYDDLLSELERREVGSETKRTP